MCMIGRIFTVKSNRSERFGYDLRKGKIAAVVRKPGDKKYNYFKFYDLMEFPLSPPEVGSSKWCYKECKGMLCTDKRIVDVTWDSVTKRAYVPRKKRSTYVMTYDIASALYDKHAPPDESSDDDESESGSDDEFESESSESSYTAKKPRHLIVDKSAGDENDCSDVESLCEDGVICEENRPEITVRNSTPAFVNSSTIRSSMSVLNPPIPKSHGVVTVGNKASNMSMKYWSDNIW